jgi:hypothetical protein
MASTAGQSPEQALTSPLVTVRFSTVEGDYPGFVVDSGIVVFRPAWPSAALRHECRRPSPEVASHSVAESSLPDARPCDVARRFSRYGPSGAGRRSARGGC